MNALLPEYRKRPDWVRRLNLFGPSTGHPEAIVPLDPEGLLSLARSTTGLDDVGDDAFLETFERRIRSIDTEARTNLLGRLLCRAETLRVLQTRLRLRQTWSQRPAILEEPIDRPIFVVGAPRTGTTILLELLALDEALRAPIAWESHHPLPHGEATDEATRRTLAEAEQELWADIQPELMTVHELRSDLPCECIHFLSLDFGSGYWSMHYRTPSFAEWAGTQPDLVAETYRGHRRFLQTLQFRARTSRPPSADRTAPERRWLLKSPGHLATMAELLDAYPDATVVHTHRDPQKFVGSAASTMAMIQWLRSDAVDPIEQGQVALHGLAFMLGAVRTGRTNGGLPEERFVDSHYLELIADPVAALEKIYDRAGLDWPSGHADTIRSYLRDKPKGKFGRHEYALGDYGLDERMVDEAYADYVAHYGVKAEA